MYGKLGYPTLSQVAYWNCTCEVVRGSPLLPALLAAVLAGGGSLLSAGFIIWAMSGWFCFSRRIRVISRVNAAGSSTNAFASASGLSRTMAMSIAQKAQTGAPVATNTHSCTIPASYEVSQAQKAILLLPHTAKGASTLSEELNAQISLRTDDEHNLPYHEDYLQEH